MASVVEERRTLVLRKCLDPVPRIESISEIEAESILQRRWRVGGIRCELVAGWAAVKIHAAASSGPPCCVASGYGGETSPLSLVTESRCDR